MGFVTSFDVAHFAMALSGFKLGNRRLAQLWHQMRCSTVSATVSNGWKTSGKVAFFEGNWIAGFSGFQVDGTFFQRRGAKDWF